MGKKLKTIEAIELHSFWPSFLAFLRTCVVKGQFYACPAIYLLHLFPHF